MTWISLGVARTTRTLTGLWGSIGFELKTCHVLSDSPWCCGRWWGAPRRAAARAGGGGGACTGPWCRPQQRTAASLATIFSWTQTQLQLEPSGCTHSSPSSVLRGNHHPMSVSPPPSGVLAARQSAWYWSGLAHVLAGAHRGTKHHSTPAALPSQEPAPGGTPRNGATRRRIEHTHSHQYVSTHMLFFNSV